MNLPVIAGFDIKSEGELLRSRKRLTVSEIACRCGITESAVKLWNRDFLHLKPPRGNRQRYLVAVESHVAKFIKAKKPKFWDSFKKCSNEETRERILAKIANASGTTSAEERSKEAIRQREEDLRNLNDALANNPLDKATEKKRFKRKYNSFERSIVLTVKALGWNWESNTLTGKYEEFVKEFEVEDNRQRLVLARKLWEEIKKYLFGDNISSEAMATTPWGGIDGESFLKLLDEVDPDLLNQFIKRQRDALAYTTSSYDFYLNEGSTNDTQVQGNEFMSILEKWDSLSLVDQEKIADEYQDVIPTGTKGENVYERFCNTIKSMRGN